MQRFASWNLPGVRLSRKRAFTLGKTSAGNTALRHCGSREFIWYSALSAMCRGKIRIWISQTGSMHRRETEIGTIWIMGKATLQTMPMRCSGQRIAVCFMRCRRFWAPTALFPMWNWAALATGASGISKARMAWYPCRKRRSGTNMLQITLQLSLRRSY